MVLNHLDGEDHRGLRWFRGFTEVIDLKDPVRMNGVLWTKKKGGRSRRNTGARQGSWKSEVFVTQQQGTIWLQGEPLCWESGY